MRIKKGKLKGGFDGVHVYPVMTRDNSIITMNYFTDGSRTYLFHTESGREQ